MERIDPARSLKDRTVVRYVTLTFFGDADAGERSAIIYSIIESCRRHGIEPYTYLHDVLTRLPSMRFFG